MDVYKLPWMYIDRHGCKYVNVRLDVCRGVSVHVIGCVHMWMYVYG